MLFALEFFLIRQFFAGRSSFVLRLDMRRIGTNRLRIDLFSRPGAVAEAATHAAYLKA